MTYERLPMVTQHHAIYDKALRVFNVLSKWIEGAQVILTCRTIHTEEIGAWRCVLGSVLEEEEFKAHWVWTRSEEESGVRSGDESDARTEDQSEASSEESDASLEDI